MTANQTSISFDRRPDGRGRLGRDRHFGRHRRDGRHGDDRHRLSVGQRHAPLHHSERHQRQLRRWRADLERQRHAGQLPDRLAVGHLLVDQHEPGDSQHFDRRHRLERHRQRTSNTATTQITVSAPITITGAYVKRSDLGIDRRTDELLHLSVDPQPRRRQFDARLRLEDRQPARPPRCLWPTSIRSASRSAGRSATSASAR